MSRPNKDMMKISEQGVITEEALLAYARNELTAGEKQEFEKLLQKDPFAQDALEGLLDAKDKSTVANTLLSVNRKVRERSGLKEKKSFVIIHWSNYAWAAVVFGLLIGIGFVMVNFLGKKTDQPMAMTGEAKSKKEETIIAAPPKPDEQKADSTPVQASDAAKDVTAQSTAVNTLKAPSGNTAPSGPAVAGSVSSKTAQPAQGQAVNTTTTKPQLTVAGGSGGQGIAAYQMQAGKTTGAAPVNPAPVANANTISQEKNQARAADDANALRGVSKEVSNSVTNAPMGAVMDKKTEKEKKAEATEAGNLDEAMKNFNSGDYKKAGGEFDKILKHDPENIEALYFGGISDYIDNKTAKSEASFDKVLKKNNKYVEGAKWYKANILLKKGDLEHAKPLLQELSNNNNPYKERAVKRMAEMGF